MPLFLDRRSDRRVVVRRERRGRVVAERTNDAQPPRYVCHDEGADAWSRRGRVSCTRRIEARTQPVHRHLEQALLAGKSLELVLPQVDELDPWQVGVLDDAGSCVRHEDLPSASGVADSGSAMHSDPDVTIGSEMWFGGVETNPHGDFGVRRPGEGGERALRFYGGCDSASGAVEGNEEAVAGRVDLSSAVRLERLSKKAMVVAADGGEHVVAHAPHKLR